MRPVQIGKSYSDGWLLAAVIAAVTCGVMAGLMAGMNDDAWADDAAVVGGVFAVAAAARAWSIARRRRWLTPTADGFVLTDRRGEFAFADADVTDLGTWAKPRFANGSPKAVVRTCRLTLHAGEAAAGLDFTYEFPVGTPDPLAAVLDRNLDRLIAQADADRSAGRELAGDGWALARDALAVRAGNADIDHRLADVAAADVVDGHVCVWVGDAVEPTVRVPAGSPNALVLYRLQAADVAARPPRPAAGDGLGRVVFERDHSWGTAKLAAAGVGALAVTLVGAGLCWGATQRGVNGRGLVFGGLMVLLPVPAWVRKFVRRVNVFRCHERGVCHVTPSGPRQVAYADVAAFTYSAVRHYTNGAYTGTQVGMHFAPADGGPPIRYSATIRNADDELDHLREFVSRVVAAGMLDRLRAGRAVDWGAAVLRPDGVQVAERRTFGKGEAIVVPYPEVDRFDIQNGTFYLYRKGDNKAVYQGRGGRPQLLPRVDGAVDDSGPAGAAGRGGRKRVARPADSACDRRGRCYTADNSVSSPLTPPRRHRPAAVGCARSFAPGRGP